MKNFYKQSLAALFTAAIVVGCGADQQQPPKDPYAAMPATSTETTGASEVSTITPQQPATGGGGPQDTTATSSDSQKAEPTSNVATMPATIDTNVTTLSDGEVFAIESAINKGEVNLAELAKKKAVSADVKGFATMALTHHRDAQTKVGALAAKEKITAQPDDVTKKLEADVAATAGDLKDKKGRDFDTAYIDSQVKMHKDGATLIDTQLLPSVKNPALKDQITSFRQTIAMHLTKAEDIQARLEAVGTTSTTSGNPKAKGGPAMNTKDMKDTTVPKM